MSYHDHISPITKSCFRHILDLRRIRPCLDYTTAANIATALVQSKLDYCNSLYIGLPKSQLNRLQNIQNALARVVANKRRHEHISPTLESLHWLKIPERIDYKILSITYNILETSKPAYLSSLLTLQPTRSTRSSKLITLYQPSVTSNRAILNRSYSQSVPKLWNSLPVELRTPKDPHFPAPTHCLVKHSWPNSRLISSRNHTTSYRPNPETRNLLTPDLQINTIPNTIGYPRITNRTPIASPIRPPL